MKDTEASATALRVLEGLLFTATRPSTAHLVSPAARDAASRIMSRSKRGARRLARLNGPTRHLLPLLEAAMLPGISLHYALRKRWIEEQVRQAVDEGARQVVNLGAGMDTLLLRLSGEDPELTCIEIDHPASQAAKQHALQGEVLSERFALLPVDFGRTSIANELPTLDLFDAELPTALICEGVLVYLQPDDVKDMFVSLREMLPSGTRLVFTFLARNSPTGIKPYGPLLGLYLKFAQEPIAFQIEPADLAGFLEPLGWDVEQIAVGPEILEDYGAPEYKGALHDLEVLAVAVSR